MNSGITEEEAFSIYNQKLSEDAGFYADQADEQGLVGLFDEGFERGRQSALVIPETVRLTVEVRLDPVPGTFSTPESAVGVVQSLLHSSLPDYNPVVTLTEGGQLPAE